MNLYFYLSKNLTKKDAADDAMLNQLCTNSKSRYESNFNRLQTNSMPNSKSQKQRRLIQRQNFSSTSTVDAAMTWMYLQFQRTAKYLTMGISYNFLNTCIQPYKYVIISHCNIFYLSDTSNTCMCMCVPVDAHTHTYMYVYYILSKPDI